MSAPLDPAYLASMSLKDLLEAHCGPGRLDQITNHGQRQILPLTVPSSGLEAREDPSLSGRQRLGLLDPPERDEQGAMDDTRGFPRATDDRMDFSRQTSSWDKTNTHCESPREVYLAL